MDRHRLDPPVPPEPGAPDSDAWGTLFDDRYGAGAEARLVELLRQPCVTFASIAQTFGVTRECVRQWHRRLLPGAPTGHERQQRCRLLRRRRHLFEDRMFLVFYRRIRAELPATRLTLIPSREGFRKRTIRLDGQLVVLTRAVPAGEGTSVFTLPSAAWDASFVYCELGASDFLFLPRRLMSPGATVGPQLAGSRYEPFKNSFAALPLPRRLGRALSAPDAAGGFAG